MRLEYVRFMPVLMTIGTPLKLNVYELDSSGTPRIVWTLGHMFQPADLTEVLNPARRLVVLKTEHEAAVRELEAGASEESGDESVHWCG